MGGDGKINKSGSSQSITDAEIAAILSELSACRKFPLALVEKLAWQESYHSGLPVLDSAHKQILGQLCRMLCCFCDPQITAGKLLLLIAEMIGVLRFHFETEELIFDEGSWPEDVANKHVEHHRDMLARVVAYEQDLALGNSVPMKSIAIQLAQSVVEHFEFESAVLKSVNAP